MHCKIVVPLATKLSSPHELGQTLESIRGFPKSIHILAESEPSEALSDVHMLFAVELKGWSEVTF